MTVEKYSRVTKDENIYSGIKRVEYSADENLWILGCSEQSQWTGGTSKYGGHVEIFMHKNVVYMALV